MNEKLKDLAEKAGLWFDSELSEFWIANNSELERFAFLVRAEERECDLHECRRKVREADDDIKRKFRGEK